MREALAEARRLRHVDQHAATNAIRRLRQSAIDANDLQMQRLADAVECRLQLDVDPDAALEISTRGLVAVEPDDVSEGSLRLRACQGAALIQTGEAEAGMTALGQVIALGSAGGAPEAVAIARMERGSYQTRAMISTTGQQDLLEACVSMSELGMDDMVGDCRESVAVHYTNVNDLEQALRYHEESLAEARERGYRHDVPIILYNIGRVHQRAGRLQEALAAYQEARELERDKQDPLGVAYNDAGIGNVLSKSGQPEEALPHLARAAEAMRALGDVEWVAVASDQGRTLVQAGRPAEALAVLQGLEGEVRSWGSPEKLARWYRFSSEAHAGLHQWQAAYQDLLENAKLDAEVNGRRQAEQAARLRLEFDRERSESEVERLREANAQQARLQTIQRTALAVVGALLLLAVVLLGLIARQQRRARHLSLTDELTGLPNRRAILARAVAALAAPGHLPVSALMMDLDRFKMVNDDHGHDAGDRVLRETARVLAAEIDPPAGAIGRWGGEEFLVILPVCDHAAAVALADRLCAAVREQVVVEAPTGTIRMTLSIGVATADENRDLDALLQAADLGLYQAKTAGRDQVFTLAS